MYFSERPWYKTTEWNIMTTFGEIMFHIVIVYFCREESNFKKSVERKIPDPLWFHLFLSSLGTSGQVVTPAFV